MQMDFSRFSYSPRIFLICDILSENQSLVHAQNGILFLLLEIKFLFAIKKIVNI